MLAQEYETLPRDGAPPLLPEAPAVSWVRINRAQRLRGHRHGAYEIVYVVRGRMDNWVGDRRFRIDAGDVFVTPPATHHGGVDDVLHPTEHCLLHLVFPPRGALPGMAADDARALAREYAAMGPAVFPGPPSFPDLLKRMLDEYRRPDAPYAALRARAALHELLAGVALAHRRGAAAAAAESAFSPGVGAAVAWLDAHLAEDVAFDALARRCGMSPTHFRRRFAREVGETPASWLNRRRVERAEDLLRRGDSITDVAFRLGFPSSQYFATVFKRYAGMTPRAWRAAAR